ncbi:MAG: malate dehydrogenase [Chlamydiae bacterium]|nr:malate dehydrogenase [Chlamydiota bacterium]MBI3276496.1 malate dehydrogenase [Chlamydiota bacterium]
MKITVVGSGNVGATTAFLCAQKGLGHVVLVDILDGIPQGKGLDILQSCPLAGTSVQVQGTNDYKDTQDSDIVVITAGLARKPGMSREDLLRENAKIIQGITSQVIKYSKNPILIVVTNPLDIMTYHAWKVSGLPSDRVMGQAGVLDSTRFKSFIAEKLKVSPLDVTSMVLGGHGDTMVPLVRFTQVSGIPLTDLLSTSEIEALVERARNGGGEIVNLLKSGSAYYAPASAVVQMVQSIVWDEKRVLPCSTYLKGQYGLNDLFIGVPIKLGKKGVETVYELSLHPEELTALRNSAKVYKDGIQLLYPQSS